MVLIEIDWTAIAATAVKDWTYWEERKQSLEKIRMVVCQ